MLTRLEKQGSWLAGIINLTKPSGYVYTTQKVYIVNLGGIERYNIQGRDGSNTICLWEVGSEPVAGAVTKSTAEKSFIEIVPNETTVAVGVQVHHHYYYDNEGRLRYIGDNWDLEKWKRARGLL